jgi:hypothetical protein
MVCLLLIYILLSVNCIVTPARLSSVRHQIGIVGRVPYDVASVRFGKGTRGLRTRR